jgi:hypothetical protein
MLYVEKTRDMIVSDGWHAMVVPVVAWMYTHLLAAVCFLRRGTELQLPCASASSRTWLMPLRIWPLPCNLSRPAMPCMVQALLATVSLSAEGCLLDAGAVTICSSLPCSPNKKSSSSELSSSLLSPNTFARFFSKPALPDPSDLLAADADRFKPACTELWMHAASTLMALTALSWMSCTNSQHLAFQNASIFHFHACS